MTKVQTRESTEPKGERIDRRRFLELGRKYAIVAPPAIGLLIAATEAEAHCQPQAASPHNSPSCATNH